MVRPKVAQDWVSVIYTLKTNEPKLGARAILARLQKAREDAGISEKCPSLRTVGRYLREWQGLPNAERVSYRWLYWPESMEQGALPWEASALALELLREFRTMGLRPTVRLARWHARVTQAAPALPFAERVQLAAFLHACEIGGASVSSLSWRRVEAQLATGQMPESWFGEELGQNLAVSVGGLEGISDILTAFNPALPEWAAGAVGRFLQERYGAGKEGAQ